LTDASESTGEQYHYSYDAAGNRLSKSEPGRNVTASYDAANQILALNGAPVQYDANGNLLNDGIQSYVYDSLDRLIGTTRAGATTTFGYTGDGDRLWEATAGVTTTFTLDLNTALTEVLAQHSGASTTRFLPGVGQQVDAAWQYLHADALGNLRQVTDASGAVTLQQRFDAFGTLRSVLAPASLSAWATPAT
jgi:YD repeat-containing protein